MGCQGWHMACASCYLGALENLLNSILDTEQLYVSFPRYLVGDPHNKFIFIWGRITPNNVTASITLDFKRKIPEENNLA